MGLRLLGHLAVLAFGRAFLAPFPPRFASPLSLLGGKGGWGISASFRSGFLAGALSQ